MGMKKEPEKHANHERYLVTYADLITLLLVFFIILFASSSLDVVKYKAIASSFSLSLGNGSPPSIMGNESLPANPIVQQKKGDLGTGKGDYKKPPTLAEKDKINLAKLKKQIDTLIKKRHLETSIKTAYGDRGLVISVAQAISFDPGSATMRPEFRNTILDIAAILREVTNNISVEGHTDNTQQSGMGYSSNWQLASMRSTNVLEYIADEGGIEEDRLSAVSFGDQKPVSTNSTLQGRIKNNRVEIIILTYEYNDKYSR